MSPDEINALPTRVRKYVHDLETICDPQSLVFDNWRLTEDNIALRVMIADLKEKLLKAKATHP